MRLHISFTRTFVVLLFAATLHAQDGSPDASFNGNGRVITSIGLGADAANAVAIQTDGKIVIGGYVFSDPNYDFTVARFLSDGTPDSSFDSDGIVIASIGTSNALATALVIQDDGRIILVGNAANGSSYDIALIRFLENGEPDSTFGVNGKVLTAAGLGEDYASAVALQPDGKIVVAGYTTIGSDLDMCVVRYDSSGALDPTFDTDGILSTSVGPGNDQGRAVAIQNNGNIVVGGYANDGSSTDFAIVRYHANGSRDNTFGSNGIVTTPIGTTNDLCVSLALQSNGRIVAAGYYYVGDEIDFALARYDIDGSPDSTFGQNGLVKTQVAAGSELCLGLAVQADDMLVVAGYLNNGSNTDIVVARYGADGTLDPAFDSDGIVTTDIASGGEGANAVAIQSDGNIVVAGFSGGNSVIARYHSASGPLPIQLISFGASRSADFIELRWTTASEISNLGFHVERKLPGDAAYEMISGLIPGAGTTLEEHEYSWIDENISSGTYVYRLRQHDLTGDVTYSNEVSVDILLDVEWDFPNLKPQTRNLTQNYPNPFNPSTTISYSLPQTEFVSLSIYDVLGREIVMLVNEKKDAGSYQVTWNADHSPSGIYLCRMRAGEYGETRKLLLMR